MAAVYPASLFPFRRKGCSDVLIGCLSGKTTTRGTGEEADLHEIRLVNVLDSNCFFAYCSGDCFKSNGAALVIFNH